MHEQAPKQTKLIRYLQRASHCMGSVWLVFLLLIASAWAVRPWQRQRSCCLACAGTGVAETNTGFCVYCGGDGE